MKRNVVVLAEAANDIERWIDFYDAIEDGVGRYYRSLPKEGLHFAAQQPGLPHFGISPRISLMVANREQKFGSPSKS